MNFEVISSYPNWYYILCLIGGAFAAFLLYRKAPKIFADWPKWKWRTLMLLRFLSFSGLIFLLLAPLLKFTQNFKEKPVIAVVYDKSKSLLTKDSAENKRKVRELKEWINSDLSKAYEIFEYEFAEKLKPDQSGELAGESTDISAALDAIHNIHQGQNTAGIILATDGINTKGTDPKYKVSRWAIPIHILGLGDTTKRRDFMIKTVAINEVAFLGNNYPVKVDIIGHDLPLKRSKLIVKSKGKEVYSTALDVNKSHFFVSKVFTLKASEVGTQKLEISISAFENESNYINNSYTAYIDVFDNRQQIVLLSGVPHPDVAALKSTIKGKENYSLTTYIGKLPNPEIIAKADLIISHDYSGQGNFRSVLKNAMKLNKPIWHLDGRNSRLNAEMAAYFGLNRSQNNNAINPLRPRLNSGFGSFTIADETKQLVPKLPPLKGQFNRYSAPQNATLFTQMIGSVRTDQPLWSFLQTNNYRSCFTAGTGIWRWKMIDYELNGNQDQFDDLIAKTIQFLSIKKDKRKFYLKPLQLSYFQGENVELKGSLMDDNFQRTTKPELKVELKNKSGRYTYTCSKDSSQYFLNIKGLEPGVYDYSGEVDFNGKIQTSKGRITVKERDIERVNLVANHELLRFMSNNSNGDFGVSVDAFTGLLDQPSPALSYQENTFKEFIHLRFFFIFLFVLLTVEWFLRKIWGYY